MFGTVGGASAFFPANVTPGPGDQFIGTNDPGLAPLANNGAPTLTHALLPGSPALDNGSNPAGLSTDQRGFPRVIGSAPDVGAFEQNSTIVVDTTEDAVDGDFSRGDRSLREALLFIADGGTILFDRRLNGETIRLNDGELVVDRNVTINGDIDSDSFSNITIDAQQESRVFNISDDDRNSLNTVTLSGLTITNGRDDQGAGIRNRELLTLNDSTVTGNVATGIGGGIHSEDSPLKLFSSTVSGNIAANGGGGIWSEGSYLRVSNSTINSNASTRNGGGILRYEGDDGENIAIISNSTLSSNSAANYGGGLFNAGPGLVQLRNSTVTNNKGDRGAGVASIGDKVTRTDLVSTIVSGNADGDIEFVRGNTNSIYS
ncbi:MAG: choice-of-anchor Q domain-containing protein [Cyanobacteria bacterium P01_A01_bin.3]